MHIRPFFEFFNAYHRDPNMPEQFDPSDGLFVFEKRMKQPLTRVCVIILSLQI